MEKSTGLDDDETGGSNTFNAKSDPPQEEKGPEWNKRARHQGTKIQTKPPAVAARRRVQVVNQGDDQERQRELNRLSKARCRRRRNDLIKKLESENARLTAEYNELQAENEQLRREFNELLHSSGQGSSIGVVHQDVGLATRPLNHNWIVATANLYGQGIVNDASHQWTGPSLENLLTSPTHNNNVVNNIWNSNTDAYLLDQHHHQQSQQHAFAMAGYIPHHHHYQQQAQGGATGNMLHRWPVAAYQLPEAQQNTAIASEPYQQQMGIAAAIATRISQHQQEHTSKPKRKYSSDDS